MRKHQFNTYVVTRFTHAPHREAARFTHAPHREAGFIGGMLNELSDYSVRFHKQGLSHA